MWIAQVILAALFVLVAVPKLFGDPTAVASFHSMGVGDWFRYLTGACEVAGGLSLLVPRLCGPGSIALVGLMACATVANLFFIPGMAAAAFATVLLGAILALVAWGRWPHTVAFYRMARSLIKR
ncbi:DoxX family protein [Fodinicola feengrottensis]|uniref:DoxX family protein n=1 Tax=Fodinicola feengrottensis TaxID=435914 RepID=UPI002442E435|nr:DoxX family protein [Fodinicola feengrottensis]